MRVTRTIMVHMYGTNDEFTELIREHEKIYGHAAKELDPHEFTIRKLKIESGVDEITLFHAKEF